MKKQLLTCMMLICASAFANAQEQEVETCNTVPVSHFSISLKGGTNYFRAAPSPDTRGERMHLILGGTVEYSMNPLSGIGLELLNNPYGGDINSTTSLDANTFDVVPYLSVNLSNVLAPYRKGFWKKLNIYSESGVGVGFYNYSLNNDPKTYDKTLLAKTGLNAEYAISQHWSLGLEGQYRYYDRSNIGGAIFPKGNCEALTATVGLRFKFGAKSKPHARNISMCEYNPRPYIKTDDKSAEYYRDLSGKISSVEESNAAMEKKLKDLEDQLKNHTSQKGSSVSDNTIATSFQTVEFGFGSDELTTPSYTTLDKMAILLNNAKWSGLKVIGNTDNTGPSEYNQKLSEKRAAVIKDYLVNKNVPGSKISTSGNGESKPIATNDTPAGRQKNRRVDFEITK